MLSLNSKIREKKRESPQSLRKSEFLPAVVYGKEVGNLLLKVKYSEFERVLREVGESKIFNLKIKKNEKEIEEYPVLIREAQKDPISEKFIHIDFYQIPMMEEVEVTVPIVFEGEAPAEKTSGAVLIKNLHEIKIEALPKNLISSIKVDVSSLSSPGDEIKIKDLPCPPQVKILADPEEIVALVGEAEEEIEIAPLEEKPAKVEETREVKEEEKK